MPRATTVRFTDEVFARLDEASARTGMPVNSIVVAACLEWMERHTAKPAAPHQGLVVLPAAPRWATIRRAVVQAIGKPSPSSLYPFGRFTTTAQSLLTNAQAEARQSGVPYIGTEHLLLAAFAETDSHAARMLAALGVKEDAVRQGVDKVLDRPRPMSKHRFVPTSRVKKVVELAFNICGAAGDPRVGTGHILLALSTEGGGIAAHVLTDLGATTDRIKAAMREMTEPEA
jgi:hypothetical protein